MHLLSSLDEGCAVERVVPHHADDPAHITSEAEFVCESVNTIFSLLLDTSPEFTQRLTPKLGVSSGRLDIDEESDDSWHQEVRCGR